jgi:hypothetical protein
MKAYIISNKEWSEKILLEMGLKTLSTTIGEAWRRHVGNNHNPIDYPIIVQRWSDKGYKPFEVEVNLVKEKNDKR